MYILYSKYNNKYFSKRVGLRNYWTSDKSKAMKFDNLNTARLVAFQTMCEIQEV